MRKSESVAFQTAISNFAELVGICDELGLLSMMTKTADAGDRSG